ncbi:MAG: 3-methyl-2-oxobutanoate hydroxymethyltransferase [Pelagibacterales bacterium]|nr:3-methyl-2-oxobutanoate hydroxymethyltransferase [Pelagibacterales bacterium]|tara:strand:- start:2531 stop:3340 length:810 start_codon:yes stop_codon:yes gene_type:complete
MTDRLIKRYTVPDIFLKKNKSKIVSLTCYSAKVAEIIDQYADIILVGDSMGMTLYGHKNTLSVTKQMLIEHGKAVVNHTKRSLIVVDLPFGTYEGSKEKAFEIAAEILSKTGANAVKLEGGVELSETIKFLVNRGIPIMGHIGLMPQRINIKGKFIAQGKSPSDSKKIIKDAKSLSSAGVFSIVVEAVQESLGKLLTKSVKVPTIGIGAGKYCDGQILVTDDMLGLFNTFTPKFVKKYANLYSDIDNAIKNYQKEVLSGKFPSSKNIYK